MTKPIVRIHDLSTDEIIDREMTDVEYAELQLQQTNLIANELANEQAKAAAQAKLTALGLTTDDLKALGLGGN